MKDLKELLRTKSLNDLVQIEEIIRRNMSVFEANSLIIQMWTKTITLMIYFTLKIRLSKKLEQFFCYK